MRKFSILPLILLGTVGSALANGPDGLRLGDPTYGGSGCMPGTARAALSPDATALTVLFDNYQAEAGRATGRSLDRKNCDLAVPVFVPPGFQVSVMTLDYRGFTAIPNGGSANFNSEYFFAGQLGLRSQKNFASGTQGDYVITDSLQAASWSDCGAQVLLRASTNLVVRSNGAGDQAVATVDSADIKSGVVFHLNFRTCGIGPQPVPYPVPPMPVPPQPQPQPVPFPVPPAPVPLPPVGSVQAQGDIEGHYFTFSGFNGQDIVNQCIQFVNNEYTLDQSRIDDINVNGVNQHNGPSYWSIGEACNIVASIAVRGSAPQPQPYPQPQPLPTYVPQPQPQPTYYPQPQPVPPTYGPACQLLGYGSYNGYTWNYRVAVNGTVFDASDSLDGIISKMQQLSSARVCFVDPTPVCGINGYGSYRGYTWNYLVTLNGTVMDANDSFDGVRRLTDQLQSAGLCRVVPQAACNLSPAGSYRGYSWNYRLNIGYQTVDASDDLTTITSRMNDMRRAGYCY